LPPSSLADRRTFEAGFAHIKANDPVMRPILERRGLLEFAPRGELFESLVESILSQQLAGAAADAIITKVRAIYPRRRLSAKSLAATPPSRLRRAGVSPQKVSYLKDLSSRVAKRRLVLESLREAPDETVIERLDEVRGVGPWTAQMVLIFTLGRPDVLPVDDDGIKASAQRVYGLKALPGKAALEAIGAKWRPYRTVGSLYLWHAKDAGGPG